MRAWIWSAVAWGSGGPPQVWRSSAWMTPCGWPVRWLQAPTRPLSSLRRAASCWRETGGAGGAGARGVGGAGRGAAGAVPGAAEAADVTRAADVAPEAAGAAWGGAVGV